MVQVACTAWMVIEACRWDSRALALATDFDEDSDTEVR